MSSRRAGAARWKVLAAGGAGAAGIGLLLGLTPAPAGAVPGTVDHQVATKLDRAEALITQCATNSHRLDYSGTQFVTIFGEPDTVTAIADLSHVAGKGTTLKLHATADSAAREVFEPDTIDDTWAELGTSLGASTTPFSALGLLGRNYASSVVGSGEAAGRDVVILELKRHTGELAAKMWLDEKTALPLRREIYDQSGRLARLTGYLDFAVNERTPDRTRTVADVSALGAGELMSGEGVAQWRANGWALPDSLGSLQLVEVRKRTAADTASAIASDAEDSEDAEEAPGAEVLHLVYSDGLSTVSVFEQAGRFDASEGWSKRKLAGHQVWAMGGMPGAIAWSAKGKVYTVVADAGAPELETVIAGLPARKTHKGILNRLHRGADRVGSWLNPFG